MPHADFKVSGVIKSLKTSSPIKGIEIQLIDTQGDTLTKPVYSNESGEYVCSTTIFNENDSLILSVRDIDSIENGLYNSKDTTLHFTESELSGDNDTWNMGDIKKVVDLYLKETDENSDK